ncbi:MAG: M2 family metallopeptidase [Fidelibacterota bacterium]|nr:MAG: M2 family metallopeptidase [Candidatus Neomarinimicrobiota bacterium]
MKAINSKVQNSCYVAHVVRILAGTTIASVLILAIPGCGYNTVEQQSADFIKAHIEAVKPLIKESNLAYWEAANSGKAEDYDKVSALELKVRQIYSDQEEYTLVKGLKESGKVKDRLLARQVEGLYNSYLEDQIEPELLKKIVDLSNEIQKNFSTHRATIGGENVTDNQIKEILKTETDSEKRKEAWLASKQVGKIVAEDLIRLVKLRNEAARKVGFDNFHTLSLTTSEQKVEDLDRILGELEELTNVPFAELKAELDSRLADLYEVKVEHLAPWHYHDPFFQETPLVYDLDLDTYYQNQDVKDLAVAYFADIGLPVESIIASSDLYEREGKNPHAFCTNIDREGDVRILCNLQNNESWMETMLHELGHAVYGKFNDPDVPFILRTPAHIFTTEAIAMFFGRLSRNAVWMQAMLGLSDQQQAEIKEVSSKYSQLKQLIFARWDLVMYNFEKQLYANPDQDLDALWWEMVEKYQLVKKPEGRAAPDWAAKIHFAIAPCYYHNYLLGELLASQLHHHLVSKVLGLEVGQNVGYVVESDIGVFLRKNVFEPGAVYHWNEMIERATGEPLTPKYFVDEFVH